MIKKLKIIKNLFFYILNRFASTESIFHKKYFDKKLTWYHPKLSESLSGDGSGLKQTEIIRKTIPLIIKKYKIKTIFDAACGDFYWMRFVINNKLNYIGGDIVKKIIELNKKKYKKKNINFIHSDLTKKDLPKVDLIICRDVLTHLPLDMGIRAKKNFVKSKSKYLLSTTFSNINKNIDILEGNFRPINLLKSPYTFGKPLLLINEKCTEKNLKYKKKCLGLWKIN